MSLTIETAETVNLNAPSKISKEDMAFIFISRANHKFYPVSDSRRAVRARETAKQIMRIRRRKDSPSMIAANLTLALRDWEIFCMTEDDANGERHAVIRDYDNNRQLFV
jgi:hypothetical protein